MGRKKLIWILVCIVAAVAAAIGIGVHYLQNGEKENTILSTDGAGYAEEEIPHADPQIVGKWQNASNTKWYKVYYDDYDEENQLFWGKEWDENEDVKEEDLIYHGNGWFRWEKKGNTLREFATMDTRDVPILRLYNIKTATHDSLVYYEPDYKKTFYRFSKKNI